MMNKRSIVSFVLIFSMIISLSSIVMAEEFMLKDDEVITEAYVYPVQP